MVKSYQDNAKQAAREQIREFIRYNFRNRDTAKLKVMCFPGAEQSGEEAIEVREIYDVLKIPRKNILGLELNSEKAERLRSAGLEIKIVEQKDCKFLQETNEHFDIISLDYTGNFGADEKYALRQIAARHLLGRRGILITNYLGKRETAESSEDMKIIAGIYKNEAVLSRIYSDPAHLEKLAENSEELKEARDITLQGGVATIMRAGIMNLDPFVLKPLMEYRSINEMKTAIEQVEKLSAENPSAFKEGKDKYERYATSWRFVVDANAIFQMGMDNIPCWIKQKIAFTLMKPYLVEEHSAFSYISNTGAPMSLDCWLLDTKEEQFRRDFFDFKPGQIILLPNFTPEKRKKLKEKARRNIEEITKRQDELIFVERKFLGSSYVPPERKPRLTKEQAIELLRKGQTPIELSQQYRGLTKMQIAALKAHITMGTYESK